MLIAWKRILWSLEPWSSLSFKWSSLPCLSFCGNGSETLKPKKWLLLQKVPQIVWAICMKVDTLEDFTKLLLQLHTYDFLTTLFKLWGHYLLLYYKHTQMKAIVFLWVLFASINGYFSWHQLYIYYLDLGKKILINSWIFCPKKTPPAYCSTPLKSIWIFTCGIFVLSTKILKFKTQSTYLLSSTQHFTLVLSEYNDGIFYLMQYYCKKNIPISYNLCTTTLCSDYAISM